MKILLTLFLLILALQISFGQENSKPILIDELDKVYPEIIGVTVANVKNEVTNNPKTIIYAVIHPSKNELKQAWIAEGFLNGAAKNNRIEANKFVIFRGEPQETFSVKFWRVLENTEKPEIESNWDFTLPKDAKPIVVFDWGFTSTNSFSGYERIFTDFLTANPKAIGQIQLGGETFKEFKEERAKLISKLSNISVKQLRFIWGPYEWKIIPPKRKTKKS